MKFPSDKSHFTFLDFFAGAGMVECALGENWDCVWANDIDPRKAAVHASNFDHSIYLTEDVQCVLASELPVPVDMAWASFPCQDLSLAGWRKGMSGTRSGAFWSFWRLMRELDKRGTRPPLIVLENVAGLLHSPDFVGLCEAISALNYQFGALLIDAVRFVPQSRPRVFVVAADKSLDLSGFHGTKPVADEWRPKALLRAYEALPDSVKSDWRWWSLPVPNPDDVPAIGSVIELEGASVVWADNETTDRLLILMDENNRSKVDSLLKSEAEHIGFVYKRTRNGQQRAEVRFDGIAGCLRTPYGGSSRQTVLIVGKGKVRSRLLTPREAARLMGAPDSFNLPPKYNDGYRAMGDGIAIPAVRWLDQHLLSRLAAEFRAKRPAFVRVAPDFHRVGDVLVRPVTLAGD